MLQWHASVTVGRNPVTQCSRCLSREHKHPRLLRDLDAGIDFPPLWIDGHIRAAEELGKPVILEEFGKVAADDNASRAAVRDPVYR